MSRCIAPVVILTVFGLAGFNVAGAQPEKSAAQPKAARVDQRGDPLPDGALARIGTTRFRHGGMDLLGFAPDGKTVMYLGSGAVHWQDVIEGKETKTVPYGEAESRNSRRFGGMESQAVLSGDTKVLAFTSQRFGGGGNGSAIVVIDTATGKERKRLVSADLFKNNVQFFQPGLSLSEDGKFLLVYNSPERGGNPLPLIWVDTTTGQRVHEIAPDKECQFGHAQFSRDGRHVVVLDSNQNKGNSRLRIFDAARGTEARSVDLPANSRFQHFELRPDGKTLLASNTDKGGGPGGTMRLFDYSAGKEMKEVRTFADAGGRGSFMQSPDGALLFLAGNGKVQVMDIDTGKQLRQIETPNLGKDDQNIFGPGGRMASNSLAVSMDGKQLAVSGRQSFAIFEAATGKQLAGGSAGAGIGILQFTPDGKGLIVANTDHAVQQWDVKSAKLARTLDRPDNAGPRQRGFSLFPMLLGAASYSSDGKLLALGMGEGSIGIWDAATGKFLKNYGQEEGKDNPVGLEQMPTSFAFAPKSNILAVGLPNGTIKLWDAATGQALRSWGWHAVGGREGGGQEAAMLSMAFSPDGKTLAGGGIINSDNFMPKPLIVLWETSTGKERLRLQPTMAGLGGFEDGGLDVFFQLFDLMAMSLNFSADGKTLAIGSFSGLHLLDTRTGKDIATYSGRMMVGRTATFSPDGKLLLFGRVDGTLRILDTATGRLVRDFAGHTEAVCTLAVSPDGKTVASGSSDSTVLLWDMAELTKPPSVVQVVATGKELEGLWTDLAGDDAAKAYKAMNVLAVAPADAVPFIKARLKTVAPVDEKLLEKLLDGLNSDKFATREKASAELEKLGDLAGPILRERLAAKPSLEMRQRMEKLVTKLNGPVNSPAILQAMRAIEVLERIGTPAALETLTALAKGARGHRVTEDARDAVQRMEKK